MTLIRVTGGNSIPATGAHAHYNSESVKSGVVVARTLRNSQAEVDSANTTSTHDYTWDSTLDAAMGTLTGSKVAFSGNDEYINVGFGSTIGYDGSTYLDQYICWQYEVRFSPGWNSDIGDVTSMKGTRLEEPGNALSVPSFDKRVIETQFRFSVTQGDCVCMPTIRTYKATNSPVTSEDPLRGDSGPTIDFQPGGATASSAADRSTGYVATDHVADSTQPFLFLPNRWIRLTHIYDAQNGKMTLIGSDESTPETIIIEDPSTPGTGYSTTRDVGGHKPIASEVILELSSSQATGTISGTNYVWWRNFIASTEVITHGPQPIA